MKIQNIFILFALSFILVSCGTLSDQTKVGIYTYKGVQYDVYEADSDDGIARVLVEKNSGQPTNKAFVISTCLVDDYDSNSEMLRECNKRFGRALERKLNPDKSASSDSMY